MIRSLLILCLFYTSCSNNKTIIEEQHVIIIMLKDKLDNKYIEETYSNFLPNDVKRSNKTLNQYRSVFTCTKAELSKLTLQLHEDPNIIDILNKNETNTLQSTTSGKASKVDPIRSKK